MMRKIMKIVRGVVFWAVVLSLLLFFLSPLLWMISTAFKNYIDAFALPPKIIFEPTLANFERVFRNADFSSYIINSIVCSSIATFLGILFGVPCAYALSVYTFKRRRQVTFFFLSLRIAPPMMSLLPMYILFNNIGLVGTRGPLLILYTAMCVPLVVWIMPVYFRDVPSDLREAAIIDGCSEFQVFYKIALPLVKASIAAVAILCVVQTWNEFLIALVFTSRTSQTLPVAVTSFMTFQGTEWGPLCAAACIIMMPTLIFGFFVQKYFARGMMSGAVKG
jgi:ABC-type glycerol-3-phosphate transport system permease component